MVLISWNKWLIILRGLNRSTCPALLKLENLYVATRSAIRACCWTYSLLLILKPKECMIGLPAATMYRTVEYVSTKG